MSCSRIIQKNGAARLLINQDEQYELAYMTYLTDRNRYADFTGAGYRLFSFPVFFGMNHLNEHSKLKVFTKGVFDEPSRPDFSVVDQDIERILQVCPNAYIFPRVNVSLARKWELEHPEELCDPYPNGELGRASFASDHWAEEVKRELSVFIEHVENMPYAEHIVGYQVAGGNTEEWLPVDKEGISGKRAQEKYKEYCKNKADTFYRFYSELTAERIAEFAGHIKELTGRRVVVGTFYGYTFEVPGQKMGHHALKRLLTCENIDFICSPISYSQTRKIGRDHPYMLPIDSLRVHGKLYFSENDTRTHLSKPVNDTPHYTGPIWFGPEQKITCEVIKMHAARALVNNHAAWWFDMWGGWYADAVYMTLLQQVRELFEESRELPRKSLAQTAVFVDEEVLDRMEDDDAVRKVIYDFRETLGKLGVPLAWYLSGDAETVLEQYKACISLVPEESNMSKQLRQLAQERDMCCIEINAENAEISTTELRGILKKAGVHIWCEQDAVIYANESFVFFHVPEDGRYVLHFPNSKQWVDVFSKETFINGACYEKGKSYLLRCSDHVVL